MKEAIFYICDCNNIAIIIKLIEKLYGLNLKTLVLTANEMEASIINEKIWSFNKLSFIPHVLEKDYSDNLQIHTIISDHISNVNNSTVLLHCNIDLCDDRYCNNLHRFTKIYSIINHQFMGKCKSIATMLNGIGFSDKYYSNIESKWNEYASVDDAIYTKQT